jgi:FixJ family two-component response regulator
MAMTQPACGHVVAVVDDDPGILRSLASLLESADYRVRLFASGAELVEAGCLAEIDCLVSDVDMPGMDGFELLRAVHSLRPGLPLVLITGYPETIKRLPAQHVGNPRVFTKPFRGPELLAAISEALRPAP